MHNKNKKSKVYIPKEFIENYRSLFSNNIDEFLDSCKRKLTKSIRVNTLKYKESIKDIKYFKENNIKLEKIRYVKNAYFIKSKVSGLG
jgi:16S rRNA C967 or C1407 C5-methylase (RsmB/RsmF family)